MSLTITCTSTATVTFTGHGTIHPTGGQHVDPGQAVTGTATTTDGTYPSLTWTATGACHQA